MGLLEIVLISFAVCALLGIVLEEITHVNKAKVTLFFGTLAWLVLYIHSAIAGDYERVSAGFENSISEIASLWLFLVAAMTFVAYLNQKGLIQNIIYLLLPEKISERKLLFLTALFCFVFSSFADNITATLVSITLLLSLNLDQKKLTRFVVLVVFAVNSGGVSLITGDVTTLMIFLEHRVGIIDLLYIIVPSLIAVLVLASLLSIGMNQVVTIQREIKPVRRFDIAIAIIFAATILATMVLNALFKVPPVLTFLLGLSVMFLVARFYSKDIIPDPIMDYIRKIEFDTLMFFLGILLIVGVLKEAHVLDGLVKVYTQASPELANFIMGVLSSLIDNVPLTAAILKSGVEMTPADWLMLTYAVGVGGSLLVIGSAAGIVAMSKIQGLTFGSYAKYSVLLLLAFIVGYCNVYIVTHYLMDFAALS